MPHRQKASNMRGEKEEEVPVGLVENDHLVASWREAHRLARKSFDRLAHDIDAPV